MKTRVFIRPPKLKDAATFLDAVRQSRSLHRGWVSAPRTPAAYGRYLARLTDDTHFGFLVVQLDTGDLVGVINLNDVIRSSFRSAFLGYYAFANHAGEGLMFEGLNLVLN